MTVKRLVCTIALLIVSSASVHATPGDSAPQHIIGGTIAPGDDAVVSLNIGCSGTLIAPNVVLTAAHCIPSFGVQFGLTPSTVFASRDAVEEIIARDYGSGLFSGGDIALIRLASDAPPEVLPIAVNATTLTPNDVGRVVRLVGYGLDENSNSGVRRQTNVLIHSVSETLLGVGEEFNTSCFGDSGGPALLTIDGVEHVAGVTSFGSSGSCSGIVEYTRVDAYLTKFILEVVDAWSGACRADGVCDDQATCPGYADPDCDLCGLQGICQSGCDDKDLDCSVGAVAGAACNDREDCEGLLCIESPEDPRVRFCSYTCDEASGSYCGAILGECTSAVGPADENACTFAGLTPRVQGASCLTGDACRSGVCDPEGRICVEQCDNQDECTAGFVCRAYGSQQACRLPSASGCNMANGGTPWHMAALVIATLLALRRRQGCQN